MILWLVRLRKVLSRPHYLMVVVTIILPVAVTSFIAYGCSLLLVGLVGGWSITVLVSVAWMLGHDRSVAEQSVDSKVGDLSGSVRTLQEGQAQAGIDLEVLERRVTLNDNLVRAGFRELGVGLHHAVDANPVSWTMSVGEAKVTVSSPASSRNRIVRLLRMIRRHALRSCRWVWRKIYGDSSVRTE